MQRHDAQHLKRKATEPRFSVKAASQQPLPSRSDSGYADRPHPPAGQSEFRLMETSLNMPLWLRFVLLAGVIGLASGASLLAYRYYTRPITLSVAVGSIDGESARAMSAFASRLAATNAPVRLKVIDSGTVLGAAQAFAAGKADLAVVRGDVGDLSQAQAVVVVSHMVLLIIAPPGSTIDSIGKLKGRVVGVIGGDANTRIVDLLSKEYGLDRAKV